MMITDLYDQYLQNPKICTDTRKITLGCLFFALNGPHFNGNEFAKEALNKGASYAIVDDEFYVTDDRYILVKLFFNLKKSIFLDIVKLFCFKSFIFCSIKDHFIIILSLIHI